MALERECTTGVKEQNKCLNTPMNEQKKEEFDKEVERWISEGILVPWEKPVEEGIIPLMAVEQPTKKKVRPVLDYRELNMWSVILEMK